jgi:regulator of protease activity HflC (stomatin/prohibitin superfamily)
VDSTLLSIILIVVVILFVLFLLFSALRVVRQHERGVVFVLGRPVGTKEPGVLFVPPFISRVVKVDLRPAMLTVQPQEVTTRDRAKLQVTAQVSYTVIDPVAAVTRIANYAQATMQLGQTALRSVLSQCEREEIFAQRARINYELLSAIAGYTERWGVEVTAVEIKDVTDLQSIEPV